MNLKWAIPFKYNPLPEILCAFFIAATHSTCLAHLILLDVITLITFSETTHYEGPNYVLSVSDLVFIYTYLF
jgi:hypothetical protein